MVNVERYCPPAPSTVERRTSTVNRRPSTVSVPTASHPALTRIAHALAARAPAPAQRDEPFHEAAVALMLRGGNDGLEALFIRRAVREGDPWSGQIALPGGRRNADGESLRQTAVRETLEEIGVDLDTHGTLLGELDELRPRTPVLPPVIVRPYVFAVGAHAPLVLSAEVAEAFWMPLREVFDPARRREITVRLPGIHQKRPAIGLGEHVIWGMTEHILRTFEELWRCT
jgi:8-oxo-dGTP pyrophosphatase MutT (NUDIX family)